MNVRKLKKLENKAEKKRSWSGILQGLAERIIAGASGNDLRSEFSASVLNRAFVDFTEINYDLISRVLGPAASEHRILLDECVDPAILPTAHQNLGVVSLSSRVFGKSVKDKALFALAAEGEFHAILTADVVMSGDDDLCFIARQSYQESKKGPQIVTLPQDVTRARGVLKTHAPTILAELGRDEHTDVLAYHV